MFCSLDLLSILLRNYYILDKELCDLNEITQQYGEIQRQTKRDKANLAEKKIQLNVLMSRQTEEENKYEYHKKIRQVV